MICSNHIRHRASNCFLVNYKDKWLSDEEQERSGLVEIIAVVAMHKLFLLLLSLLLLLSVICLHFVSHVCRKYWPTKYHAVGRGKFEWSLNFFRSYRMFLLATLELVFDAVNVSCSSNRLVSTSTLQQKVLFRTSLAEQWKYLLKSFSCFQWSWIPCTSTTDAIVKVQFYIDNILTIPATLWKATLIDRHKVTSIFCESYADHWVAPERPEFAQNFFQAFCKVSIWKPHTTSSARVLFMCAVFTHEETHKHFNQIASARVDACAGI